MLLCLVLTVIDDLLFFAQISLWLIFIDRLHVDKWRLKLSLGTCVAEVIIGSKRN